MILDEYGALPHVTNASALTNSIKVWNSLPKWYFVYIYFSIYSTLVLKFFMWLRETYDMLLEHSYVIMVVVGVLLFILKLKILYHKLLILYCLHYTEATAWAFDKILMFYLQHLHDQLQLKIRTSHVSFYNLYVLLLILLPCLCHQES